MSARLLRSSFRRLAIWRFTLLKPTGTAGRLSATAKVIYTPQPPVSGIWIPGPGDGSSGEGGDRERYSASVQLLSENAPGIAQDWKVLRGEVSGHVDESLEWNIDFIERVSEYGSFYVLQLKVSRPAKGASRW